jgi:superfamily II DNA/RNA helicase
LKAEAANLRGLIRVLLFKRFESSVFAFQETVRRLLKIHNTFLKALDAGFVPAGEDAQTLLYESDWDEEVDLVEQLRAVSTTYSAEDFDLKTLRSHIEHDITILDRVLSLVEPIKPEQDAKLQTLIKRLEQEPLKSGKRLIFTQYADTARYLFENLKPHIKPHELEVIFSGDKSKARVVGRFAPKANPEYKFQAGEAELSTVVATDVLSEGLNLQDCNKIINYDLHWNPVRLIQRFGRIDRIGSDHDQVYGFNFLPETGLDRNLGLRQKLHNRVQEIHDTIGEDSAILDSTERLNEEAMYAIYEKKGKNLSLFEEDEEENFVDLNEAEEILRQLRKEKPKEYERIANMRDGIRAAMASPFRKGLYVFCQADRYQQLFLLDNKGEIVSRDIPKVLGAIKCGPETPTEKFPSEYNAAVMRVTRQFVEEVKHREAEREHTVSLTHGHRRPFWQFK